MTRCVSRLYWLILILVMCAGCGMNSTSGSEEETDWEPTPYETVDNLGGVTMSVTEGTVSPTGLTVKLINNSDKPYVYGEYFWLEKKIGGSWYQVPVVVEGDYGFTDIAYDLAPSTEEEWPVDWDWLYGSLEEGEYRIIKDIMDFRGTGDYDRYYLTASFAID